MGTVADIRRDTFAEGFETFDPGRSRSTIEYPCLSIHKSAIRIALNDLAMEAICGQPADEIPDRVRLALHYSKDADAVAVSLAGRRAAAMARRKTDKQARHQWELSCVRFAKDFALEDRFNRAHRYHLVDFGGGLWGARLDNRES